MLNIALFGDSIGRGVCYDESRGRYSYLKDSFDKLLENSGLARIINRSRFGAIAAEGLVNYQESPTPEADYVAIEYGGNDCTPNWQEAAKDPEGFYPANTSLPAFEKILRQFVNLVRQRGQTPILVTCPPLLSQQYVDWISQGLHKENILRYLGDVHRVYRWQEQYALAIHQVARLTQCYLFDLRAWFLRKRDLSALYCVDGMHPNQLGHQWIAKAVETMMPVLGLKLDQIKPQEEEANG